MRWKGPGEKERMAIPSFGNEQQCSLGRFSMASTRGNRETATQSQEKHRDEQGQPEGALRTENLAGAKGNLAELLTPCKATAEIRSASENLPSWTQHEKNADKTLLFITYCSECLLFKTLSIPVLILI